MPFLSKHFTFDYDFSSVRPVYCTSRHNRTDEEKAVDIYNFLHRPTLSAMFYNNLKETLQHTTLENITYYDDDLSIKIFGINLKFACAQNSTSNYYCTPIAFEQFINSNGILQNSRYIKSSMEYKTITSTTDKDIKTISYGIKVYYNNNFIICNYESYLRFEIPIFCIIQGNVVNDSKKVAYLGQCPNVVSVDDHYEAFYHRLVIPDESSEYDSVFPNANNMILYNQTVFNNTQVHYIFDAGVYPNRLILNTLYDTDTQFQSVYMKKLTSWNGLVQYNNVYDVVVKIDGSYDENISKITTNSVYTINGNQYYCPGIGVTPYITWGVHENRKPLYLFKL